jgi:FkbM family methyltransferase
VREGGVVDVYGLYKLRLRFRSSFERVLFASGTYEPSEAWFVRRVMRHGGVFIDVGANEGLFTLVAAAHALRPVRVHAFEPSARERRRLVENVQLNHIDDVRIAPVALGARRGSASLRIAREPDCGLNTIGADFAYRAQEAASETVEVDTLDAYLARNEPRPVTAIKIDVEGFEVDVLRGAHETLARDGPALVVEINAAALAQCNRSVRELVSLLRAHGYELFTIGDGGALVPLGPAHEQMSLNAVALKPPVWSP